MEKQDTSLALHTQVAYHQTKRAAFLSRLADAGRRSTSRPDGRIRRRRRLFPPSLPAPTRTEENGNKYTLGNLQCASYRMHISHNLTDTTSH